MKVISIHKSKSAKKDKKSTSKELSKSLMSVEEKKILDLVSHLLFEQIKRT